MSISSFIDSFNSAFYVTNKLTTGLGELYDSVRLSNKEYTDNEGKPLGGQELADAKLKDKLDSAVRWGDKERFQILNTQQQQKQASKLRNEQIRNAQLRNKQAQFKVDNMGEELNLKRQQEKAAINASNASARASQALTEGKKIQNELAKEELSKQKTLNNWNKLSQSVVSIFGEAKTEEEAYNLAKERIPGLGEQISQEKFSRLIHDAVYVKNLMNGAMEAGSLQDMAKVANLLGAHMDIFISTKKNPDGSVSLYLGSPGGGQGRVINYSDEQQAKSAVSTFFDGPNMLNLAASRAQYEEDRKELIQEYGERRQALMKQHGNAPAALTRVLKLTDQDFKKAQQELQERYRKQTGSIMSYDAFLNMGKGTGNSGQNTNATQPEGKQTPGLGSRLTKGFYSTGAKGGDQAKVNGYMKNSWGPDSLGGIR